MKQFREKLAWFLKGRYGVDELGRTLMAVSVLLYLLGGVFPLFRTFQPVHGRDAI